MDAISCIESRRSIRKFTEQPVDEALVRKLVSAAQMSPSWKNSQTARFTAVCSRDKLDAILPYLPDFNARVVNSAPLLVAVSVVTRRSGYDRDGKPSTVLGEAYTYFDCGAAAQTLCLAANACGLGTVVLGIFDQAGLKTQLSISENEDLVVLIACGYGETPVSPPTRRPLEEVLRFL